MCAQAIDQHPQVKHWIRNLVNREAASLAYLLLAAGFYPDFTELHDGRTVVVEYKGEYLQTADDAREKAVVGQQWAQTSGGLSPLALAKTRKQEHLPTT